MAIFTGRARKKRANASTSLAAHHTVPAEFHTHSMHVPSYTMTNEHGQRAVLVGGVLQFELLPDDDHGHMRDNAPKKRSRKKAVVMGPETRQLLADALRPPPSMGPETRRLLADALRPSPSIKGRGTAAKGLGTAAAKRRSKKSDKKSDMNAAISKLLAFDASAIRENASFTLDQTYGAGHGDRSLIQKFYATLNKLYPGSTPVPIPPESQVHPKHDVETQKFIFADFAVRKIALIALRAARLRVEGARLERLDPITNKETADAAAKAASYAYEDVAAFIDAGVSNAAYEIAADVVDTASEFGFEPASVVAHAAYDAAKLNPDATWAAVNEMLQAL